VPVLQKVNCFFKKSENFTVFTAIVKIIFEKRGKRRVKNGIRRTRAPRLTKRRAARIVKAHKECKGDG
jgi:hypothetical protein